MPIVRLENQIDVRRRGRMYPRILRNSRGAIEDQSTLKRAGINQQRADPKSSDRQQVLAAACEGWLDLAGWLAFGGSLQPPIVAQHSWPTNTALRASKWNEG